ncbi:hypothetical protein EDD15DRAFT_2110010, partial [Pisolithus albus]
QASGKTSFVNVINSGQESPHFTLPTLPEIRSEDVVPTVAFTYRKFGKAPSLSRYGMWHVAGQPKFRSTWERYCHGMDSIYSADHDKFDTARFELHQLLSHPGLTGIPLLVV